MVGNNVERVSKEFSSESSIVKKTYLYGDENISNVKNIPFLGSQSTMCKVLGNLSMGNGRRRPRKKSRKVVNLFYFNLGKRCLNKHIKRKEKNGALGPIYEKAIQRHTIGGKELLETNSNVLEAAEILDAAINTGLEVNGGRDEGIKILAKRLYEGLV